MENIFVDEIENAFPFALGDMHEEGIKGNPFADDNFSNELFINDAMNITEEELAEYERIIRNYTEDIA